MVLDPIVRSHSDAQHVFGTRTLMKTAQNTEHTSTTSEFVKAGKRFRQEFEFSSASYLMMTWRCLSTHSEVRARSSGSRTIMYPPSIDSRSKPVPDRSNVILIQVHPCLASSEH